MSQEQLIGQFRAGSFSHAYNPLDCSQAPDASNKYPIWYWQLTALDMAFSDPLLTDVCVGFSLQMLPRDDTYSAGYLRQLLYRRAYRRLRDRLRDPYECHSNTLLASSLFLAYYEGETSSDGFAVHIKGASALMQARGSIEFTSRFGTELYWGLRLARIVACWNDAISEDTEHPSMPIPTFYHTAGQLEETTVLDGLGDLPRLVHEVKAACKHGDFGSSTSGDLIQLFYQLEDLQSELAFWGQSISQHLAFWHEPSPLYKIYPEGAFPSYLATSICFSGPRTAAQSLVCWTTGLVISELKLRLLRSSTGLPQSEGARPNDPVAWPDFLQTVVKQEAIGFAQDLLRSTESLHSHMTVACGHSETTAALNIVKSYLLREGMSKELSWIKSYEVMRIMFAEGTEDIGVDVLSTY